MDNYSSEELSVAVEFGVQLLELREDAAVLRLVQQQLVKTALLTEESHDI